MGRYRAGSSGDGIGCGQYIRVVGLYRAFGSAIIYFLDGTCCFEKVKR